MLAVGSRQPNAFLPDRRPLIPTEVKNSDNEEITVIRNYSGRFLTGLAGLLGAGGSEKRGRESFLMLLSVARVAAA
jgi:hypothetical protein